MPDSLTNQGTPNQIPEAGWLAAIIESSDDAIVSKDLHGTVTSWNRGAENIFGYSASEMIGQSITRLIPPERHDDEEHVLGRIREGKSVEHYETVRVGKDGRRIDISLTVSPIRNSAGEVVGASKVARDITRRKQAQEALRASEARLRQILNSNIVGVVFWNLQGEILEANDLYLDILGFTRDDLRRGDLKCHNLTPPEHVRVGDTAMGELTATGTCAPFEKECLRKDGSRVSVLVGSALLESGKQTGCSFVMDITERKRADDAMRESERKYRDLVEMSHDLVWAVDTEGRITYMSPASRRIYGREPEEMTGRLYADFVRPEEARRGLAQLAQMVATGDSVIEFETRVLHRDGHEVVLSANAVVRRDAAGNIVGTTGASRDITERKEVEAQLKASREELRLLATNLRTAREEEAIRISREIHDQLGQALTGLQIDVAALGRALEQQGQPEERTDLMANVATISKGIEQTLQTARRVAAELRPAMLDELGLTAAIEWQTREFEERSAIFCNLTLPPNGPRLEAECATAVFRIFQEVLTNVARHACASEVSVELRAEPEALVLKVSDNGVGIEQLEEARRRGYGLVGIQERALAAGIRVQVKSRSGHGTTVLVEVPQGENP